MMSGFDQTASIYLARKPEVEWHLLSDKERLARKKRIYRGTAKKVFEFDGSRENSYYSRKPYALDEGSLAGASREYIETPSHDEPLWMETLAEKCQAYEDVIEERKPDKMVTRKFANYVFRLFGYGIR